MKKPLGPLWTRYLSGSESIVAKLAFTSGFIPWGMGMKLPREQKSAVKPRYSVQFSRSVVSDSFVTPWTIAHQAPLSTRFPKLMHVNVWQKPPQYSKVISLQFKKKKKKEYWSGLPFPLPEYLPDPEIEPVSPAWQADSLLLSHLNWIWNVSAKGWLGKLGSSGYEVVVRSVLEGVPFLLSLRSILFFF